MSRPSPLLAFAPIVVAILVGLLSACHETAVPRFGHRRHLASQPCGGPGGHACLTCATCHGGIRESEAKAMPTGAVCAPCHAEREPGMATGASAQSGASGASVLSGGAERAIRFSHRAHLPMDRVRGQCISCHVGVVEHAGAPGYPPMAKCLSCHSPDFDEGRCTLCHQAHALRKLVPTSFMRHDPSWIRRHGLPAAQSRPVCMQCHTQAQCADCHDTGQTLAVETRRPDNLTTPFVHRANFLTRHAIEARSQPTSCLRCHTTGSCDACHVERGISALRAGAASPHPKGWIGPGSADTHGRAARRDILSCAGCHDLGPATNCIRCHRVGAGGGNPHPGGWQSSRSPSASMCRYCHEN